MTDDQLGAQALKEIRELTKAFNSFEVEVAANMIPREEYDRDQQIRDDRQDRQREKLDRVTLKVYGIVGGFTVVALAIGILGPYLLGG